MGMRLDLKKSSSVWIVSMILAGLVISPAAFADQTQKGLSVERVMSGPDLSGPRPSGVKLSPDGRHLTFLKTKAGASGQSLWIVPASGGEPQLLVDAAELQKPSAELSEAEKSRRERMRVSGSGIIDYQWDDRSSQILVPFQGDIYLAKIAPKAITQLTKTEADEIDAKLSPNGQSLAFVRDGALVVRNLLEANETLYSPKAEGAISYASAEFIAQEELDRFTGYWWAPDSKRIAYQKTDESGVEIIPRHEIGAEVTKTVEQRYPRAGQANAKLELYIADGIAAPIKVDLGSNPDFYLARVDWAKDGKSVFVQRLSRDQKRLDLLKIDAATGVAKTILSETSQSWVELHYDFKELKDGRFIWASERDGNKHLYLFSAEGTLIKPITHGDWVVDRVSGVDEAKDMVYFEGFRDGPLTHHLYQVSLKSSETPKAITKGDGWWSTQVASSTKTYIGNYSDPNTPPQTALFDISGKLLRFVEENPLNAQHPYAPFKDRYSAPEFGTISADDGQLLHWSMLKPVGFDPAKKYPVIVSIYGGPARATVNKSWVSMVNRLYQENGYIVFSLDNRGTPNRSVAFGRAIYKRFGGPDIDDQIKGGKFLQSLPYVDPARIGITGWSQGGFVTLMALTAKDTPFAAGIAGAPPTQWDLYDTAYTERYMSTPQDNKAGYAASDVISRLDNLKPGSLMLMHGMADDNVLLANSTRLMLAMQNKGIPFELMLYPGERHGIRGAGKSLQRQRLWLDFFERKLKP